jgi:hypothetical protein
MPTLGIALADVMQHSQNRCVIVGAGRGRSCSPCPIRPRRDGQALLSQDLAGRLDAVAIGPHLIDEGTDQRWRGPSSIAKKIDVAFRIGGFKGSAH